MKRQPRILAGTALGLLMASAPLGAAPLRGDSAHPQALPLILAQAKCAEGESAQDCAAKQAPAGPEEKQRRKQEKQAEPEPAERAPAAEPERKAEPAEQAAPAEAEQKPRKKREKQAEPEPAEKAPAAEPEQKAAPAEQAAPAEAEQKPRKKREKQAEPTEQNAPKPEAKPAQAEQAPAESGQSSGQAAEPGSQKEKLRDYLKKKQQGETPAEPKPEEQAAPTGKNAPKPEAKPAQAEQAPAQGEQPAEQAGQPKSEKEKLRDYLKKKKEGGEASPQEAQQPAGKEKPAEEGQPAAPQAEQPQENKKAGEETAPAGKQAQGEAGKATQPELPSNTREQVMPKPREKARPQPENAAPLPDSAKQGPAATGTEGQAAGTDDRQKRKQQRQAEQAGANPEAVPKSDSAAQTDIGKIGKIESVEAMQGKRLDRKQWMQDQRKWREGGHGQDGGPNGGQVINEINNRYIVKYGDNIYVDNRGSNERLERDSRDSYVEALPDNFTRYTIVKDDGTRIVTIRNSYGDIVRRSRIMPDDREVILYYVPESDYGDIRRGYYDAGADLPPLRLDIPADEYILDAQYAEPDDYYTYLDAPPVEPVERIYSVDEVVHSARIRDKVRRIDLDTITFDTGSAEIGEDQVNHLQALGDAINKILKQNPAETFLIEGHTDAVGSDESNLVLSDERAQSVAEALTSVFNIPAENLTTQGYGERYLKVKTQGPDRENRRVAIRRITPLVAPVASAK